jgi:hypothetical protein
VRQIRKKCQLTKLDVEVEVVHFGMRRQISGTTLGLLDPLNFTSFLFHRHNRQSWIGFLGNIGVGI